MKKRNLKKIIFSVILISVIFTIIDALIHYVTEALEIYYYPIPAFLLTISSSPLFWYAIGKFVGTIIMGIIILMFLTRTKLKLISGTFIFALIIIILLEVRYILSGYYSNTWHVYNTIMHSVVLFVTSYIVFLKTKIFVR